MKHNKSILIVAGEPSGDLHGANLARALRKLDSNLTLCGVGGEKMTEAQVKLYFNIVELAGIGVSEVFRNLIRLYRVFRKLVATIEEIKPEAIVLIDFPEFNLRLAKTMKKFNIPIIYYISPQVWAWRPGRIKAISRYIKKMLVVFPFEEEFYQKAGIPVEFVGHPLLDMVFSEENKEGLKDRLGIAKNKMVIGLLPGSRESEVRRHFPIMFEVAGLIKKVIPEAEFLLPINSSLTKDFLTKRLSSREREWVRILPGQAQEVMNIAELILVASGTATLEAACYFCPMVIIYKISFLTWLLIRPLIRVPYVGLVNLIAREKIVPEYLQFQAQPKKIAQECLNLLKDEKKRQALINNLRLVRKQLGNPGASEQAARAILNILGKVGA